MWNALREIARREKCKIHDICSLISLRKNRHTSLTAAIRVFLMLYYRAAATEEGHKRAAHGSFENMMSRARMTNEMLIAKVSANMNEYLAEKMRPVVPQTPIPCESLAPSAIQ
jgi:NH3-dependent NAD+ synthetase